MCRSFFDFEADEIEFRAISLRRFWFFLEKREVDSFSFILFCLSLLSFFIIIIFFDLSGFVGL